MLSIITIGFKDDLLLSVKTFVTKVELANTVVEIATSGNKTLVKPYWYEDLK